jgi:hypothetical protein
MGKEARPSRTRTATPWVDAIRWTTGDGCTSVISASRDAVASTRMADLAIHSTCEQSIAIDLCLRRNSATSWANDVVFVASILAGGVNTGAITSPHSTLCLSTREDIDPRIACVHELPEPCLYCQECMNLGSAERLLGRHHRIALSIVECNLCGSSMPFCESHRVISSALL